jgi:hypothetical protein
LHDDAWWSATVRDAAKSGGQCITKIEGQTDDVVVAMEKTMAWSMDGPGKAVDKCGSGDKVLVESDGGWYPAKITDKQAGVGKCAVKYEDPNSDPDTVPLKRVRRLN